MELTSCKISKYHEIEVNIYKWYSCRLRNKGDYVYIHLFMYLANLTIVGLHVFDK